MFLRKIFRYLFYSRFLLKLISMITGLNEEKFFKHRTIMLNQKMTSEKWISINTDGPDCPLSRVYTKKQVMKLFQEYGFKNIKTFVRFFSRRHYGYLGRLIPKRIANYIGLFFGWHRIIKGIKPVL